MADEIQRIAYLGYEEPRAGSCLSAFYEGINFARALFDEKPIKPLIRTVEYEGRKISILEEVAAD